MFHKGEIVDERYRIVSTVGSGGYGTVFLAEELHPPHLFHLSEQDVNQDEGLRKVALKVFARVNGDDVRFQREIQALCRLEHPHIVPIYNFGRDHFSYLSMRYVDGIDLTKRDEIDKRFTLHQRIAQLIEIAEGLGHAHERGIVHRDLKPSNILIDKEGHAWIVDFGLAWMLNPDETTSKKVGTPGYLAPELIESSEYTPDHRADIYSLGATIHAAFSGHSPFRGDGLYATVRRQLAGEIRFDPIIPHALRDLIVHCTEIIPARRPRTAYEVADALRHILQRMAVPTPDIQTLSLQDLPDKRTDLMYLRVESIERIHHPQRGEGVRMRLRTGIDQECIGAFAWFDNPSRAAQQAYQSYRMIRQGMRIHLLHAPIIENSRAERYVALDAHTIPILEPEIPIPVTDVAKAMGVASSHCARRPLLDWHTPRPFTRHIVEGGLAHDILEHLVSQKEALGSKSAFAQAFVAGLKSRKVDCIAAGIQDENLRELQEKIAEHFRHLHNWFQELPQDRRLAEVQRISSRYGLEGRIDLVLEEADNVSIVELKTGRYIADEHEQQVRAYGMMWARPAARMDHPLRAHLVYSQIGKNREIDLTDVRYQQNLLHARNGIIAALYELAYGHDGIEDNAPTPPTTPVYGEHPALCRDQPCRFRRDTCAAYHQLLSPSLHSQENTLEPVQIGVPIQAWYNHFDRLIAREYLAASRAMGEVLTPGTLTTRIEAGKAQDQVQILLIDEASQTLHLRLADSHMFQQGDRVLLHHHDYPDTLHFGVVKHSELGALEVTCGGAGTMLNLAQKGWVVEQRPVRLGFQDAWRGIYNVLRAGRPDVEQWLLSPHTLPPMDAVPEFSEENCPLNAEQRQAVALGLSSTLPAVIQGPPGTGKTAVIAEIVARLVEQGKRILVATNTHSAADNALARIVRRGVRSVLRVGGYAAQDPLVIDACASVGLAPSALCLTDVADAAPTLAKIADTLRSTNVFVATANAALRDPVFESLEQQTGYDAPGIQPIFDVVIIDEASQLTEPLAAGLAVRAERMIFVGDDNQLPPVVTARDAQGIAQTELPSDLHNIGLGGLDTSLFSRLQHHAPTVALRQQYRMNEGLQTFPSLSFYDGALIAVHGQNQLRLTDAALREYDAEMARRLDPAKPNIWVDVGSHTNGHVNLVEAREVATTAQAFLDALTRSGESLSIERVGIISPFRAQVRAIRAALQERLGAQAKWIQVDTVERFQGRERDVILLSLASAQWSRFVFDAKRLNVALTRARYKVVLFGPTELGTRMIEHFVPASKRQKPNPAEPNASTPSPTTSAASLV